MKTQNRPAVLRRWAGWILLAAFLGLLIVGELTFQSLKGKGWTNYTPANSGLAYANIIEIAVDDHGRVWVGTNVGLSALASDGRWTTYTTANSGLENNTIKALAVDDQGQVWVGTNGGGLAVRASDGKWMAYLAGKIGVANNIVNDLAFDDQGRVWMATQGGLNMLSPDGSWISYIGITPLEQSPSVNSSVKPVRPGVVPSTSKNANTRLTLAQVWAALFIAIIISGAVFFAFGIMAIKLPGRQGKRRREVLSPAPVPQTVMSQAHASQPAVGSQPHSRQEISAQRQELIARHLAALRHGDHVQRQQALTELEKMGEVEAF